MSLLASTPSLHLIPLRVPLVMRQSSGSLWNLICISKKQAQCTLLVSCPPPFSSQLQTSIHLYSSFLSTSLTSLPQTFFLHLHQHLICTCLISCSLYFIHKHGSCFRLFSPCIAGCVYNGMKLIKGHELGLEPTVLWELSFCQQDAWALRLHEEQQLTARNRTF